MGPIREYPDDRTTGEWVIDPLRMALEREHGSRENARLREALERVRALAEGAMEWVDKELLLAALSEPGDDE